MSSSGFVVVTGASTGIGFATAQRLAREGYQVFAGVRRVEDGVRVAAESARIRPVMLDVTRADQIAEAAAAVGAVAGTHGLAALVNNAGIAAGGPIEFVPVDEVRHQFEINVFGVLAVTQAFLPLLRLARGRIVNIGSISGKSVTPYVTPYAMSKHAIEALSDGLRLELGEAGIQTALIEPGAVKTPIWEKGLAALADAERNLPPAALERYGSRLRFFGKLLALNDARGVAPETVADAVLHAIEAAQPKTRYVIGGDARTRAVLGRLLPDRVADGLLLRVLARLERRLA